MNWLELTGGPMDDYGLVSAFASAVISPNPAARGMVLLAGAYADSAVDAPNSLFPITRQSRGGFDGFVVSYDGSHPSI